MHEALAFLTPIGGARDPTPRALRHFPVTGAAIGLALGALWWLLEQAWPAPVAAIIVVLADIAVTGMLHLDGLADAADGLLPHLPRERRLEVMAEPGIGAFGVVVTASVLIARFTVLAVLAPAPLLIGGLWCLSRTSMAATVDRAAYAREGGGLGTAFQGARVPAALIITAGAAAAIAASFWSFPAGLAAVCAGGAAFAAVIWLAVRRIGGYTGDVLGAAGVIAETVGLIVAAARW